MKERLSRGRIILILLLALNLVLSGVVLTTYITERAGDSHVQEQYTLYIGTNDKDTNRQELSLDECRARVEKVCLQYVTGFTITEADGAWTDDAGNIVKERTLVCCINGAEEAQINAITDELLMELNQHSIMIEHESLEFSYRSR